MTTSASQRREESAQAQDQPPSSLPHISRYREYFSTFDEARLKYKCALAHERLEDLLPKLNQLAAAIARVKTAHLTESQALPYANSNLDPEQNADHSDDSLQLAALFTTIDLVDVVNILIAIDTIADKDSKLGKCPVTRVAAINACIKGVDNVAEAFQGVRRAMARCRSSPSLVSSSCLEQVIPAALDGNLSPQLSHKVMSEGRLHALTFKKSASTPSLSSHSLSEPRVRNRNAEDLTLTQLWLPDRGCDLRRVSPYSSLTISLISTNSKMSTRQLFQDGNGGSSHHSDFRLQRSHSLTSVHSTDEPDSFWIQKDYAPVLEDGADPSSCSQSEEGWDPANALLDNIDRSFHPSLSPCSRDGSLGREGMTTDQQRQSEAANPGMTGGWVLA